MRLGQLKAIGHNIADSFGGNGFLVGHYPSGVYEKAAASPEGFITVNFLTGEMAGAQSATNLKPVVRLYRDVLPDFCAKHGVDIADIDALSVTFGPDPMYDQFFEVTVQAKDGRWSVDRYVGIYSRRAPRT
jgi:hypothetical protein